MTTDQFVVFQLLRIDAVRVPDASVHFSDADTLCPVPMKVTHWVKTHITETLQDNKKKKTFYAIMNILWLFYFCSILLCNLYFCVRWGGVKGHPRSTRRK